MIAYDISSAREALGVLFQLEGTFGITPNKDGTLSIDPKADGAQKRVQALQGLGTMPRRSLKGAR